MCWVCTRTGDGFVLLFVFSTRRNRNNINLITAEIEETVSGGTLMEVILVGWEIWWQLLLFAFCLAEPFLVSLLSTALLFVWVACKIRVRVNEYTVGGGSWFTRFAVVLCWTRCDRATTQFIIILSSERHHQRSLCFIVQSAPAIPHLRTDKCACKVSPSRDNTRPGCRSKFVISLSFVGFRDTVEL